MVFKLLYCIIVRIVLSVGRKWGEVPYVQSFMSLHNSDSKEKKERAKFMVQRKDVVPVIQKGREQENKRE